MRRVIWKNRQLHSSIAGTIIGAGYVVVRGGEYQEMEHIFRRGIAG
jgi:hypothetical protein